MEGFLAQSPLPSRTPFVLPRSKAGAEDALGVFFGGDLGVAAGSTARLAHRAGGTGIKPKLRNTLPLVAG
jgi:hypothetical protein